jgi:hypothetical protein
MLAIIWCLIGLLGIAWAVYMAAPGFAAGNHRPHRETEVAPTQDAPVE